MFLFAKNAKDIQSTYMGICDFELIALLLSLARDGFQYRNALNLLNSCNYCCVKLQVSGISVNLKFDIAVFKLLDFLC